MKENNKKKRIAPGSTESLYAEVKSELNDYSDAGSDGQSSSQSLAIEENHGSTQWQGEISPFISNLYKAIEE